MDKPPLRLRFGPFEFDEADARLAALGRPVALAPKTFGVLAALLRQGGQLVTKDALLDAVWGHRHVSESVLKSTISELRAALGDDARNPRWVETASRRGYRFIGAIETTTSMPASPPARAASAQPDLIGREDALARLRAAWSRAAAGQRQLVCVAGEAGIGKSTLIDGLAGTLAGAAVAHGQCIEQVGEGEPYLPVLDALAGLARRDEALPALLRQVAPTWLLQMPWLVAPEEQARLRAGLAGATGDRMLREFAELAERLTEQRPLLLVTEDLHWCDEATVRLLDHVARRRAPARLMWIASFRIAELVADGHPLNGVRHELRARRLCEELLLDPFSEAELAAYLARHRPALAADEARVRRLHRQTDGLPLFVAHAVDELPADAAPREDTASDDWPVPDTLSGVIERQLGRLAPAAAALLEAAAVCGVEFDASVVADMRACAEHEVADGCAELVRRQYWLQAAGLETRADGALDARFAFRHALYRQVIYRRIAAPARAALHRRAAAAIARRRGGRASPAVLALHHERGLDAFAALRAYTAAAVAAMGRFAPREALSVTERALALLARCPEGEARLEAELALMQARGAACAQSIGIGTDEARAAFRRVAELCGLLPPTVERAWALTGLGWMLMSRGEYASAEALARQVHAAAGDDPMLRATACVQLAGPLMQWGRLAQAGELLEEAVALVEAAGEVPPPPGAQLLDPRAIACAIGAVACAHRGLPERARALAQAALARAAAIGQPITRGFTWRCACMVAVRLDEPAAVHEMATRMRALVREHALAQGEGPSRVVLGWAQAMAGEAAAGAREIVEGYADLERLEARFDVTLTLRLAAEAALLAGDAGAAREHVERAFDFAERLGERLHLPDLWLVRAALARHAGDRAHERDCAAQALRIAREIGGETAARRAEAALRVPGQ